MIERMLLFVCLRVLRIVRWAMQTEPHMYALLGMPALQPALAWIGRAKAYEAYLSARRRCPAYRQFLAEQHAPAVTRSNQLPLLPATTKENYVKKYDIESRCTGGAIPAHGVVIDESSGSSGAPNNWVRGPAERNSVKAIMQLSLALMFDNQNFFILNCFALGPWATGMNVSMSLADVAILKSIGPDKAKLENALRQFGTRYRYLVAGYPPFIKNFVDTTTLDLGQYDIHLILGGEGMSEGLRAYLAQSFKSVFSSYGASDLEINIGAETPFTIALRQLCWKDATLSKALFGREDAPMIFQYNPLDHFIEQNAEGEVVFTIARLGNVAPKIRYNLHDRGGAFRHAELVEKLRGLSIDAGRLAARGSAFPILFIYGRNDQSVPFFGCKIFSTDLDHLIHADPRLSRHVNSFQLANEENEKFDRRLHIHLEGAENSYEPIDAGELHQFFYTGLARVNQDFREITKMIAPEQVKVTLHPFGTGPFADRDIRIKSRYIAPV